MLCTSNKSDTCGDSNDDDDDGGGGGGGYCDNDVDVGPIVCAHVV